MSNKREQAKRRETIICDFLQIGLDEVQDVNCIEYKIAQKINRLVNEDDEKITGAKHIGNTYDSIGDIKVETTGSPYYIEIKIKNDTSGFGTLANITPKTILLADIFKGDILLWKDFLELHNHTEEVISKLNQYPNYTQDTLKKCNTPRKTKKYSGKEIRDVANSDSEDSDVAQRIKKSIEKYDESIKYKYLRYLSAFPINNQNLKEFLLILIAGYHKKKQIKEYMTVVSEVMNQHNFEDSGEVFDTYEIIYGYTGGEKLSVEEGTQSKIIEDLSNIPFENYDIKFGGEEDGITQTNMVAGFYDEDGTFQKVIRFNLHWGNVFQGINTRRFNCFKSSYIKDNY